MTDGYDATEHPADMTNGPMFRYIEITTPHFKFAMRPDHVARLIMSAWDAIDDDETEWKAEVVDWIEAHPPTAHRPSSISPDP